MQCHKCEKKAVIVLQHSGLCESHFLSYFEEKVEKTINKFRLIDRGDTLCVAASGGKDSLTVLYLTKKYLLRHQMPNRLFALSIDEGIKNYRKSTLTDLKKFCKKHDIELHIVAAKEEFGYTLDQAAPKIKKLQQKKACNICGVWRRFLLNKYAKKLGATKVITGHNLDDEAQVVLMNIFKANTSLTAHLGPKSGVEEHEQFASRVKPLYFCTEKETRLYALLKKFEVDFTECPNAQEGLRAYVRDMLNDAESKYPGTKQGIINSFLDIMPLVKEREMKKPQRVNICTRCGEPTNNDVCNACKIKEALDGALRNVKRNTAKKEVKTSPAISRVHTKTAQKIQKKKRKNKQ